MPTNKQRREAERRRLQRQLEQRRQREIARRRFTLISSVVGTLAVIVIIVIVVIAVSGGDKPKTKKTPAAKAPTSTAASSAASSTPVKAPTTPCATNKGATASFKGVTVAYANNLKHEPKIRSTSTTSPATIECQDLVVGTGTPAGPGAAVSVQYTGVLYKNGKQFDSSWTAGKPVSFTLKSGAGGVIPGFTAGIGGAGKVAPMKVGGRRIIVMPSSLAYGTQASSSIPANSPLVFVVDLKSVKG